MTAPDRDVVVRMRGIRKSFMGVEVLKGVDLTLRAGEVHALVGENGAGKSTLMRCLAGIHSAEAGTIELDGSERSFATPREAQAAGIAIVHQELTLLPERTVAENIYLGREPSRRGTVDRPAMVTGAGQILTGLGVDSIRPTSRVATLSVAQQQIVEIAKALVVDAKVLAMDEPTAALADAEVALLYALVRRLCERGIAVLYVSHRMPEIFDLSSQVTVLKDGGHVLTADTSTLRSDDVVRAMVGRPLSAMFPGLARPDDLGDVRLSVSGGGNDRLDGIDLEVRAGEVVGVGGLQGSGRSALARAVSGTDPFTRGTVAVDGRTRRIGAPRAAIEAGIAFVTEDRKGEGLALRQSVRDNVLLVRRASSRRAAKGLRPADLLASLTVTAPGDREVRFLSGGNQQKVVLAKWLLGEPGVLVIDEPTRGIDVGAKAAIYSVIRQLAHDGVAVLVISSELPELIGLSDRVVVMHQGRIAGELSAGPSEEAVMLLATGHDVEEAS